MVRIFRARGRPRTESRSRAPSSSKKLSSHEVTNLRLAWNNGDRAALEALTPLV
jgi:hypothetical protein